MKKLFLITILFITTNCFAQVQTVVPSNITNADQLPTMKPNTLAVFSVDRIYTMGLQADYKFYYGAPANTPLSTKLAYWHLNIISTLPGITGYWSTKKSYNSTDNIIDFNRSTLSKLTTQTEINYQDSLLRAKDSLRLATQIQLRKADSTQIVSNTAAISAKPNTTDVYTKTQADAKYYLQTNPCGYISSYTETDPTVPAYAKSLTAFSVIKASTDNLYMPLGYTAPVTSVSARTGAIVLTKTDVGLSNVDNTSDVNKPVSTAQAAAINPKIDSVRAKVLIAVNTTAISNEVTRATAAENLKEVLSNKVTTYLNTNTSTTQYPSFSALSSGLATKLSGSLIYANTATVSGAIGLLTYTVTHNQNISGTYYVQVQPKNAVSAVLNYTDTYTANSFVIHYLVSLSVGTNNGSFDYLIYKP